MITDSLSITYESPFGNVLLASTSVVTRTEEDAQASEPIAASEALFLFYLLFLTHCNSYSGILFDSLPFACVRSLAVEEAPAICARARARVPFVLLSKARDCTRVWLCKKDSNLYKCQ